MTYCVGHETIVPREGRAWLSRGVVSLFIAMARNGVRLADVLKLPHDHVVEIGARLQFKRGLPSHWRRQAL